MTSEPTAKRRVVETSAHWGTHLVELADDGQSVVSARAYPDARDASPAIGNVASAHRTRSRVLRPAIRRRWLENGPAADDRRGDVDEEYVELEWEDTLDLLACELDRVRTAHGNQAIYGGSYGWGSAGRLHHPQSQLHRFLNGIGGYTSSVGDYSYGASQVLLPYVIGHQALHDLRFASVSWEQIAEHTDLLVTFGGLRKTNVTVVPGGHARSEAIGLARHAGRSTRVVSISAARDDAFEDLDAEWIAPLPGTDTALILALIHVLVAEGLADEAYLADYTEGVEKVRSYVLGESDGVSKSPEWAEAITTVPPVRIRDLAREMSSKRTLVNVTYSLQRSEHGEQAVWAALTLACFLGQLGLPGGGFAHGLGSMGDYGIGRAKTPLPTFPQGVNPVSDYIPCARVADMLLHPGEEFPFDGELLRYPDVRLAYWAGGNPFHHHQDLRRLRQALARLDTFVVHETHWTTTAKHADIVLPVATSLERDDVAAGVGDSSLRAMRRATVPPGDAREELWIYTRLGERLGVDVSEGLDTNQWLERLYEDWRSSSSSPPAPPFDDFWATGRISLPDDRDPERAFTAFRADPVANPLDTLSGRVELFSAILDAFDLPDIAGHASWFGSDGSAAPLDDEFNLHLICHQPSHRLHSQHDMGDASQSTKVAGREPIRLNPDDAATRDLRDGSVAKVRSAQGSLLAGVVVTDAVRPGVAQMQTGAWYDPSAPDVADCIAGNVNVLTCDTGTSSLTQACSGGRVRVAVERYDGPVPDVRAYDPPPLVPHVVRRASAES